MTATEVIRFLTVTRVDLATPYSYRIRYFRCGLQERSLAKENLYKTIGSQVEHLFGVKTKTMEMLKRWPRGLSPGTAPGGKDGLKKRCGAPLSETTE